MTKNALLSFCLIALALVITGACATDQHRARPIENTAFAQQDSIGQKIQWLNDAVEQATPATKEICHIAEQKRHFDNGITLAQCCFYYVCVDWMQSHRKNSKECLVEFNGIAPCALE